MEALYNTIQAKTMKSQYPVSPVTYQTSEPSNYLKNYAGLRQVSREKAESLRSDCIQANQTEIDEPSTELNQSEDDSLSSFFYTQGFTLGDND